MTSEQKNGNSLPAEGDAGTAQPLRILLLEDTPTDAKLNEHILRKAGIAFTSLRVDTRAAFIAALDEFRPDLILADYNLPNFDGLQALAIVRERSPDLPYIFVSGAMGDEQAVEFIRQGANDYILKDRLTRLPAAVRQALSGHQARRQLRESEEELRQLLDNANQSRRALLSVVEDQKRAQAATEHANRALATLSAVNHSLVHASDENELLQEMCRVIVKNGGYNAAWVGYAQHDAEKSIRPMAQCGLEADFLDTMQISWADSERGQEPAGKAVRSGKMQVVQDIANDPGCVPWKEQALKHGNASTIAMPLFDGADVQGSLTIYAAQANAFSQKEIALLEEMSEDLSYGIRMLRLRQKQQQQTELLRKSLEDTVRAIATIVEMRDPYTAGHQVRVADLATAIARQMGLPEEQVHVIHLAGVVHDLGKINVPAEILSKPGRLADIEYRLIKVHPQAGYDILKGIDFPWPIADMVLQHHERMDGSGYPQGLKGGAILLEARILAVADVVEAMSSHRPYRAGLGIEVALEEITKNRDKFYDPQAVDACVTLFREKGFVFGA